MSDVSPGETRPWLRAIGWIALLGPFFFASYGFANWLASRRSDVGAIAFAWETSIPFVPWTIVPYWSIDLFYGLSLLLCATRLELDRHAQRLFAAQVVSVVCFVAFPLRFSFDRPAEVEGIYGALFTALGSFDKPFNQAPSLHISLLVLIWVRLAAHCRPAWLRGVLHGWMLLVGASVLTTFQHHFIDIPTGLAVGVAILWALPIGERSPLAGMKITGDPRRRRVSAIYATGAVAFTAVSLAGGWWLWMLWPALSCAVVALNYLAIGERGFQKSARGTLSAGAWGMLAPYIAGAWANSRLRNAGRPSSLVVDGVSVGRVRGPLDADRATFASVVDMSAELPFSVADGQSYRSIPVLDLTAPSAEKLRDAIDAIEAARSRGPVLVCCAVGLSRSASAVVAWLVATGRASTIDDAIRMVRDARPSLVVYPSLRSALEELR